VAGYQDAIRHRVTTINPGGCAPVRREHSLAGSGGQPARHDMEESVHNDQITDASPTTRRPWARAAVGLAAAGALLAGGATAAFAAPAGHAQYRDHHPSIRLVVTNPRPGDIAGTGGDFTVDLIAQALNARGNNQLSASHGYRPGLNLPPATTFGPGMPDPNAPGLVVTLSTTPQAAGGPNANLAGVFQLNSVSSRNGLTRVINDWEVGVPGFFGTNTRATLTAFLVRGTAPGVVTGHERPISNVIHETFTIGG